MTLPALGENGSGPMETYSAEAARSASMFPRPQTPLALDGHVQRRAAPGLGLDGHVQPDGGREPARARKAEPIPGSSRLQDAKT